MSAADRGDPATRVRIRRIAETWRMLEPSPGEVVAARARIAVGSLPRRERRAMPGALAVAIVLAGSAAFAGARVVWTHVVAPRMLPVAVASASAPSVAASSLRRGRPAAKQAPSSVEESPLRPIETTPIVVDVNDMPSATVLPAPERPPALPASPASRASPASPPSLESSRAARSGAMATPSAWGAAADAMRSGDYAQAERAFGDIARSDNPRTRDDARLARAQVWIAEGRTAEARPELASLAATGATALVREQAADALKRLP